MDPEEQGQDSEIQVEENSPSEEQLPADDAPQHEGGYNPAFEPIRQKLGLQFETIKDDLLEVEKGFNSGITKANSKATSLTHRRRGWPLERSRSVQSAA